MKFQLKILLPCLLLSATLTSGQQLFRSSRLVSDEQEPDDSRNLQESVRDAVVIGAGWAGLGAAKALTNKGVTDYLVLEGRDYVGGRSQTISLSDGKKVDLGSQWIHGATLSGQSSKNPVFIAAREAEALNKVDLIPFTYVGSRWSKVYDGSGEPHEIPQSVADDWETRLYNDFVENFMHNERPRKNKPDRTVRECLDDYITEYSLDDPANLQDRLGLEHFCDYLIEMEYGASLEDMSLKNWDSDKWLGTPYEDVVMQQGYAAVVDHFASPYMSKIQLNSKVTSIDWSNTNVKVYYTENGVENQVEAKNVVVTVPLGVLQQGSIAFEPALPSSKREAIDRLGMGLMNKVVLRWDDSQSLPWHTGSALQEWLLFVAPLGQQGNWTGYSNEMKTTGQNILIAFIQGNDAERVESLTDAETKTEVLEILRSMFGGSSAVPDPAEVVITRWGQDEFSYGSYSYYKKDSVPTDRDELGETLGDRLWFAGEAVHKDYPSTTYGALMSGEDVGKVIGNWLRRQRRLGEEAAEQVV